MADFYAARGGTIPPLPWTNFAPPLSRSCLVDDKASGHECGGAKRMNHGADSFCKTNASRRPEFIKSESEPKLDADYPANGVNFGL